MKRILIALVAAAVSFTAVPSFAGSQVSTKTANKYAGESKAAHKIYYGSNHLKFRIVKDNIAGNKIYVARILTGKHVLTTLAVQNTAELFGIDATTGGVPKLSIDYNNRILQQYMLVKFQKGKGDLDLAYRFCKNATKHHWGITKTLCQSAGLSGAMKAFDNYYNTGRKW